MPTPSHQPWRLAAPLCVALVIAGCSSDPEWVSVRSKSRNPFTLRPGAFKQELPEPSPRTAQLLRRYDLGGRLDANRKGAIIELGQRGAPATRHEHEFAMAELAYLGALENEGNQAKSLDFYGAALLHSYRYLFRDSDKTPCNPYDPQFRGACDLYNKSLEGLLRVVRSDGGLRPGDSRTIVTEDHVCGFEVELHSTGWHAEDFDRFEFVSDYRVNGLRNHYQTYGLGVPLIAIRKPHESSDHVAEKYYPSKLCFPLTAFLRISEPAHAPGLAGAAGPAADPHTPAGSPRFVLEMRDPMDHQTLVVNGRQAPLESDLSTPLAYFLNQPELQEQAVSTLGLLRPDDVSQLQGLYMLEPYDPNKMPVLMVHGLWSSPITWMEMYNDLRSDPLLRSRYQFWSYLYPTGQPFWISASQLREELEEVRDTLDPGRTTPALDQMVLVGHSMGGLVSKLQSVDSGRRFWSINSDRPFEELRADAETYNKLAHAYFFRPNASVRRVVTIGTPHRGSRFANGFTRWLGRTLINTPMRLVQGREQLLAENAGYFRASSALDIRTSIDSLAPESPLLPVLLNAEPGPWVTYHNIVGREPDSLINDLLGEEGDGVVSVGSASIDDLRQVASQIVVPSDHVSVHRHPQSVLEVRRILLEQLEELKNLPYAGGAGGVQLAGRAEAPLRQAGPPGGAPPPVRR
ncbi:MAG: alpha/beta fold hydrolase [Planctomycetota bacterium]